MKNELKEPLLRQKILNRVEDVEKWLNLSNLGLLKGFFILAMPYILSSVTFSIIAILDVIFIGRLNNSKMLAGLGLGLSTSNIICTNFLFGINTGLQTLVSRAYGQGNIQLCGSYLNTGRAVHLITFFITAIPLSFSYQLFRLIGCDPVVSMYAYDYLMALLPASYFQTHNNLITLFLSCMQNTWVGMVGTALQTVLHPLWLYIFIFYFDLGVYGCAIANAISQILLFIFLTICPLKLETVKNALFLPKINDCFAQCGAYLQIAIPATLMTCFEWWFIDILIFLGGFIGIDTLAANVILLRIQSMIYVFFFGLSESLGPLVGNFIGANKVMISKRLTILVLISTIVMLVLISGFLVIQKTQIVNLFTQEPQVSKIASSTMLLVTLQIFFNSIAIVLTGPIRALGKQAISLIFTFITFYVLALPATLFLAFYKDLGLQGLWLGAVFGQVVQCLAYGVILLYLDWQKIADSDLEIY